MSVVSARNPGKHPSGGPIEKRNPYPGLALSAPIPVDSTTITMDANGTYTNPIDVGAPASQVSDGLNGYHDHASIRDWVHSSAVTGPFDGQALDGQNVRPSSGDMAQSIQAFHVSASVPLSRICSQSSTGCAASMQQLHSATPSGSPPGMSGLPSPPSGDHYGISYSPDSAFSVPLEQDNQHAVDFGFSIDSHPFPGSLESSIPFTGVSDGNMTTMAPLTQAWTTASDTQGIVANTFERSHGIAWNVFGTEPSSCSSQSSHPDTPLSMAVPDEQCWMDDAGRMQPQFQFRPVGSMLPPAFVDNDSTIRPTHGSQRTPLPGPQSWQTPQDLVPQAFGSPVSMFTASRRSSEGENVSARKHHLYQIKPDEDGWYTCIFEDKEGRKCDSDRFRLKCNYDKHLDSHLKPYRCKWQNCKEGSFSSTACLLRHEREAHGMHGHMEINCVFDGCERSYPNRGFPRKWNAQDHMKRVHGWIPPEGSGCSDGSSPSSGDPHPPAGSGSSNGKKRVQASTKATTAKKPRTETMGKSTGKITKNRVEDARGRDLYRHQKAHAEALYGQTDSKNGNWTASYKHDSTSSLGSFY